jgi:hypothetical protein
LPMYLKPSVDRPQNSTKIADQIASESG